MSNKNESQEMKIDFFGTFFLRGGDYDSRGEKIQTALRDYAAISWLWGEGNLRLEMDWDA